MNVFMWNKLLLIFILFSTQVYAINWVSETKAVQGHDIHYYTAGSGTPVFLLPGYAVTSNFWNKKFVNCLADKHTVYLIDYWGVNHLIKNNSDVQGHSTISHMAQDSFELSKALNTQHPVFVGWSLGGAVAQRIGLNYGDAGVQKIVLIAPLTRNNMLHKGGPHATHHLTTHEQILNYVFNNNLYHYTPSQLSYYNNNLFNESERLFTPPSLTMAQDHAVYIWLKQPDHVLLTHKTAVKYLFLIPLDDTMLSAEQTLADARLIKTAKIIKVAHSGHNLSMQFPEQTCQQINNFIK